MIAKTYYVNQRHPQASDDNPGTSERPFRTVNRAAQVLQPGQRVVIAAGVYRERVQPARGGSGPTTMIGYEAAPGAEVILRGSRILDSTWTRSGAVWKATLSPDCFPEENPFKELNLTDEQIDRCMPWAVPIKGKLPNTLRRGLIFQNGQRLKQVPSLADVARTEGSYWVEPDGLALHVRPLADADPTHAQFEVTVRGSIFAPKPYGLGFIRVVGLTIEHAGNRFPRPQEGALSTRRGHHWLIERNTVRQCNAIGIDIGDQFDTQGPELAQGGQHIIRDNTVTDCGIGGVEGKQIEHTLIERNTIRRCGWQNIWPLYECAGIKVHCTRSCLLRHNVVTDTIAAPGIWMDYANVNSRCTANVILNTDCNNGGIFMEASQEPNLVDRNVVWATRGHGIYQHDCDELIVAHNFVAQSTQAGIRMQVCQGRMVNGRLTTAKRNQVLGNILFDNKRAISFTDPENRSDYNVFASSGNPFDLAAWQKSHGWDQHGVAVSMRATLDAQRLELSWKADSIPPMVPRLTPITHDFFERPLASSAIPPGPFGSIPSKIEPLSLGFDGR